MSLNLAHKQLKEWTGVSAKRRRTLLVEQMFRLEKGGVDCFSCSGTCCTYLANSMMTTPLETLDLVLYLQEQGRIDLELQQLLLECIKRYRLDQEPPGDGRRGFVRRHYTCPFFATGPRGCSLSRNAKPYGCLGFNPQRAGIEHGGDCSANVPLLQQQAESWCEAEGMANARIRTELLLDWEKRPMPLALFDMINRLGGWQ